VGFRSIRHHRRWHCASSLVQGVHYYREAPDEGFVPGLMHPRLGGYHVGDIEFSAAFDIDERKVGKELAAAIFEAPNNTVKFAAVRRWACPCSVDDARRPRHLSRAADQQKAPGSTGHRGHPARDEHARSWSTSCPWAARWPTKCTSSRSSTAGCAFRELYPRLHRARGHTGAGDSRIGACPWWVTT